MFDLHWLKYRNIDNQAENRTSLELVKIKVKHLLYYPLRNSLSPFLGVVVRRNYLTGRGPVYLRI